MALVAVDIDPGDPQAAGDIAAEHGRQHLDDDGAGADLRREGVQRGTVRPV